MKGTVLAMDPGLRTGLALYTIGNPASFESYILDPDDTIRFQERLEVDLEAWPRPTFQRRTQPVGQRREAIGCPGIAAGSQHRDRPVQRRQILQRRGQTAVQHRCLEPPAFRGAFADLFQLRQRAQQNVAHPFGRAALDARDLLDIGDADTVAAPFQHDQKAQQAFVLGVAGISHARRFRPRQAIVNA